MNTILRAFALSLTTVAATAVCQPALAGEVYLGAGVPGLTLGYAHPVNPSVGVRVEASTIGNRKYSEIESGITYNGRLKGNRLSLLGDWFVMQGGFRLSAGVGFSDYRFELDGSGGAGTVTLGSTVYNTTAADGLRVDVTFPKTMPYLGLGWGHHAGSGWRFAVDLGAYFGKGKLTVTPRGQLALPAAQSDLNTETQQLRESLADVKFLPQLGFSVGYSF